MATTTDLHALDGLAVQVCVVGSGPVGASLAIELVERGLSVVVLESGLDKPDRRVQALADAVIETPRFHQEMALATRRALGGTSWLWGGRCAGLDEIDFAAREYMPGGGWPVSYRDVSAFYPRAAELLGIGTGAFRRPNAAGNADLRTSDLEIWTNETRIHERLKTFGTFDRVRFVLNATVVDLEIDDASERIGGVVVTNGSKRLVFRSAEHYVLALGGVETARLLLNVQARRPSMLGGPDGPLGRFYMGHVSGSIAEIRFVPPATAREFQFQDHSTSASRARLTLSSEVQWRNRLPNIAFWPANPPLSDAAHRSGFLSFCYLLLNLPVIGSAFVPEAIRKNNLRENTGITGHVRNCLNDFPGLLADGAGFLQQRVVSRRRIPRWFKVNGTGIYRLHYHGEQRPDATNRVSLAADRDAFGLRRAVIRFEIKSGDVEGVYRAHDVLDRCARKTGLCALTVRVPRERFLETAGACSADGMHQIGTTRMARDQSTGVVDADCRVFGLRNLHVAGSSVFCTSGQANPTFPAVALALRLAAHLEVIIRPPARALPVRDKPLRILHVIPSIDTASGGPSRAVFDLALAARERGHAATICATDFGGPAVDHAEYVKAGIRLAVFPAQGPSQLQYAAGMQKYIRDNVASFDIVHLHSLYLPSDWMVYRYAIAHGIPYILRPHGTFDPVIRDRKRLRKWVMGKLFQDRVTAAAAGIHYTSANERSLSDCSHPTAWIVPLPIRPEEFAGDADPHFRARFGLKRDFVLFLGRLAWKKGIDIGIRAFAEFAQQHNEVDFVIAGPDSGEEQKLRALVRDLGLDTKVHFTGVLDGPARIAAYRNAKLFLVPSRGENFGRTVAEAMIAGTPIVMTDRVGIWKEIVHADAGCVIEADAAAVLAGLQAAWNSYPTALERSARARKLVEFQFSVQKVGEQLDRMYNDALLAHARRSAPDFGQTRQSPQ